MSTNNNIIVINTKSTVLAYVLWFFLGQLGVHRFYLNSPFFGLVQLGLTFAGWALSWLFGIGFLFLGVLWIWLLFDLIWIPLRTGAVNNTAFDGLAARLTK
jgi:TM2 domain-containing membrane protein YozV